MLIDIVSSSKFWLIFALIILMLYMFSGGLSYINCFKAFKGYSQVFKNNSDKVNLKNLLFFVLFPAILSIPTNLNNLAKADVLNIICVVVSILTAMLYSFMGIINAKYEMASNNNETSYSAYSWIRTVHKETIDIITCETIVSVFLLILCFIQPLLNNYDKKILEYNNIFISVQSLLSFVVYYCFYFFILNLLIVTKRFYRITQQDVS